MKKSIVGICMLLFVCIASISVSCNAEGQNAASDDQKDEVGVSSRWTIPRMHQNTQSQWKYLLVAAEHGTE